MLVKELKEILNNADDNDLVVYPMMRMVEEVILHYTVQNYVHMT
jgi:hypothetical protein